MALNFEVIVGGGVNYWCWLLPTTGGFTDLFREESKKRNPHVTMLSSEFKSGLAQISKIRKSGLVQISKNTRRTIGAKGFNLLQERVDKKD